MGKRGDIVAVLVIVLVALVRFTPFFIGGNLVNSDSWKNYYPWQESYKSSEIKTLDVDADVEYHVWLPFARKEIAQGRFPNWNPYSFSGSPLYANHLVPVFHIPLAIALLFPSEKVPTAYALVMLIMGPLFFYFFLRNWRLGCFVSLFGAIAFMFSGRMDLSFPPDVASFIWVPAILLFYDRFVERGNIYDAFLGAFCLGQLLIAGYPVYVIHFAYFATVYVLWRRFHPSFAKMISTRRWLTGLLVILVGSVLISAVQNYPTYEYMKLTKRGLASEKAVFEYQMSSSQKAGGEVQEKDSVADGKSFILEKLSTKVPYIIPAFMQYKGRVYVGAVVIFLVLIGLVCSDRKFLPMKIYILVLMVLVLIPPVFRIFAVWVPGWSISARNPVPIFFFTLLFLGSLGLDIVLKKEPRSKTWFFVGAIYLAILFCLARLHPAYYLEPYKQVYRWNVQDDVLFLVAYISISALIIAYLVLRFYMKKVSREWDYLVIAIFICISFWTHIYSYQNFISPHPMQSGKEIQRIKELSDGGRIVRYDPAQEEFIIMEKINAVLPPNLPGKFGIYDVQGYDSLVLAHYDDFLSLVEPGAMIRGRGIPYFKSLDSFEKMNLLRFGANTRCILTNGTLVSRKLEEVFGKPVLYGSIRVYSYGEPKISMYRLVPGYKVIGKDEAFPGLEQFSVVLEKEPALNGKVLKNNFDVSDESSTKEYLSNVPEIIERTPTSLKLRISAPDDCLLYVSEVWHPRWRARLDGKEVEILKANVAFRAIAVPKGQHEIFMWYDGIEVLMGGLVSAITIILLVLWGFVDLRVRRKK